MKKEERKDLECTVYEPKKDESLTGDFKFKNLSEYKKNVKYGIMIDGISSKKWIKHNGEDYLFKEDSEIGYQSIGETFTSFFCKKIGVECAETSFAIGKHGKQNVQGVISKSFIKENQRFFHVANFVKQYCKELNMEVPYYSVTTKLIYDSIVFYANKKNFKIDENLKSNLLKMALVDFFLCQWDRHKENIGLLLEKDENGNKVLKLAPMFDNGLCFAFRSEGKRVKNIVSLIEDSDINFTEIRKNGSHFAIVNSPQRLNIGEMEDDWNFDFDKETKSICKAIVKDEEFRDFYNVIKNVNILSAIEEFEKEAEIKIPEHHKVLMAEMYEDRRYAIKNELPSAYMEVRKDIFPIDFQGQDF